jgi:hypothetical protein
MAETSYYFDGLVTGDAVLAPYTAALYTTNWKKLFTRADDEGVISRYENELLVSGITGGVIVDTGAALVEGYFYENTAQETVTIPTPVTDPRIDRIVLRKDSIAQTVRIYRIPGTENPAPTAPALTQTAGGVFEVPLAQVLITIAGAITVTDERDYPWTPLIPTGIGIIEIETIISDGVITTFDFQNIPQIYTHLRLIGATRGSVSPGTTWLWFNGDTVTTNYWLQWYSTTTAATLAAGAANIGLPFLSRSAAQIANEATGGITIDIMYYTGGFYKVALNSYGLTNSGVTQFNLEFQGVIWENTDPIDRISLPISVGVFESGSRMTLYGLI